MDFLSQCTYADTVACESSDCRRLLSVVMLQVCSLCRYLSSPTCLDAIVVHHRLFKPTSIILQYQVSVDAVATCPLVTLTCCYNCSLMLWLHHLLLQFYIVADVPTHVQRSLQSFRTSIALCQFRVHRKSSGIRLSSLQKMSHRLGTASEHSQT